MDTPQGPTPFEMPGHVVRAFLVATSIEAVILLMVMGYSPLYMHQHFHSNYLLSSMGAALPALMTFLGSTLWGQMSRRLSLLTLGMIGLLGYLALGAGAVLSHSASVYLFAIAAATLFSSALAPATLALLTVGGGNIGRRLANRLQWQSLGWMVSGLFGGWIYNRSPQNFPWLLLALGISALLPLSILWKQSRKTAPVVAGAEKGYRHPDSKDARKRVVLVLMAVVLPFFLAYAGNEGFFTNFGLYLHASGISVEWVGWSSAISTAGGWLLASRIGRWSDHYGGRGILIAVFTAYGMVYLIMALIHLAAVSIAVFSLPLYPLLNIGVQRAGVEDIPAQMHGAIMGWINGASGLATFAGTTLLGEIENHQGPEAAPWGAFVLVGAALTLALIVQSTRQHPGKSSTR